MIMLDFDVIVAKLAMIAFRDIFFHTITTSGLFAIMNGFQRMKPDHQASFHLVSPAVCILHVSNT